jgi:hypothetical protein
MRLSAATLAALAVLAGWFGLDFVGVAGIVDREPVLSLAGLMLAILAVFALLALGRVRFAAPFYAAALFIWAALQVETHWSTYLLFDASERKLAWYQSVFGPHWRFLPEEAGRTTPDGYHTVLAMLIIVNLLLALRDVVRR